MKRVGFILFDRLFFHGSRSREYRGVVVVRTWRRAEFRCCRGLFFPLL